MTTLAYSRAENRIAIDSRITAGEIIQTDNAKKWVKSKGEVYFITGCLSDVDQMLDLINSGELVPEFDADLQVNLIRVTGDPVVFGLDDGVLFQDRLDTCEFKAYGSGASFALAALDLGCTVKQAVSQAMKRDIYTGGKVVQYDLTKQRFLK